MLAVRGGTGRSSVEGRAHGGTEAPPECVVVPGAGEADMKTKAWEITCAMASFGLIATVVLGAV